MNETYSTLLRAVLKIGGGFLLAHGLASDSQVSELTGALTTVIGVVWGIISASRAKASAAATQIPIRQNKSGPLLSAVLAAGLAGALLLTPGCKTSNAQSVPYQVTGTAVVSVDTLMNVWGAYVKAAHPGTNAESQVKTAFDRYQASAALVCDAGAAYAASGGTNALSALNAAIANSSQSLADLQQLITTLQK